MNGNPPGLTHTGICFVVFAKRIYITQNLIQQCDASELRQFICTLTGHLRVRILIKTVSLIINCLLFMMFDGTVDQIRMGGFPSWLAICTN